MITVVDSWLWKSGKFPLRMETAARSQSYICVKRVCIFPKARNKLSQFHWINAMSLFDNYHYATENK